MNPQDRTATPKNYAEAVSRGAINLEQLLDAVCSETTLNRDEARMAFNRLFKKAEEFLGLGFNVHLGELGYMHLTVRSNGTDTPEEVTAAAIKDVVPHFVFGKNLRANIKKVKFERESK
jgi:nucleoid DNA-binding protein